MLTGATCRRSRHWSFGCLLAAGAAGYLTTLARSSRADAPSPKRPLPDYDGRPPAPADPTDAALLVVPRLLLSPLYLANEYLVRQPLAVVVPAAERRDVPRKVYDFFTFGPNHNGGFLPVGFAEFDLNPSVGIYAYWRDVVVRGHDLHFHAETWTSDWLSASLLERFHFDHSMLELLVRDVRRPDYPFYGTGPSSLRSSRSRYGASALESAARLQFQFWRSSRLEIGAGVRAVDFHRGFSEGDPTVEEQAATGAFPLPDGFGQGYTVEFQRVVAVLDSRRPWPMPGSGVRLKLKAEEFNDVRNSPVASWLHTEAVAAAFCDLNGFRRVLSLSAAVLFVDPLGHQPAPFTELVTLGGNGFMRGFPWFRLVDRSAAVATLRYDWPVGPWIVGTIQGALGNVFGQHLESFETGLLRMSWAVGLSSALASSSDYPLEVLVGFGTETFNQGLRIEAVRVTLGVNYGI